MFVQAGLGITVMPRSFAGAGIAMPLPLGFALSPTIGLLLAVHVDEAEPRLRGIVDCARARRVDPDRLIARADHSERRTVARTVRPNSGLARK